MDTEKKRKSGLELEHGRKEQKGRNQEENYTNQVPRLKEQLKTRYAEANKAVKKLAKQDKRAHIDNLANEAEEAAKRQDMKTLYRITAELKGGHKNSEPPVKDLDGNCITSETEKVTRWKHHFETILSREEPRLRADIKDAEEDIQINTNSPTIEEVEKSN